ncbi:TonB-dependent receptor [Flavobacterium sp. ANB]|uniref:TonB-dependent receptor n=1 Tax=unclassified Flavobacterium TaxID=196869 RepID=UPI0012B80381|nr:MULTISPECIES: carboxypeptidase-like regulatory domain-containing protein [unclassified Flavobacterium]MBF4516892.1 TonB-dependent receptor [Flavobacterium sp. ANB]MTD69212.1 TonB-dependent receptor plug domain-containing protein [Flavobacterium sp. LC2016-13]
MRFILFFVLISSAAFSQRVITGKIIDKESSTPLSGVLIRDTKSENWAMSEKEGNFEIKIPYYENVELNFSLLGKMESTITLKNNENYITVFLEDNTLRLKEVVVTANKERQYSELTLGKNAINNVQAFSLDDVLKQLPGQTTANFELNSFKNIVFRTASSLTATKAFGTSFVLNDIPISNNENMQALNPNASTIAGSDYGVPGKTFNNPDVGVDLREISTNTIEDIKVIQGIPSAKYGDLTSGLVLITTKVGNSPYRVSASLRDATSELNLTKGVKFNSNNAMNFGINYLDSNADPRDNLLDFQRVNGSLSWQVKNNSSKIKNTISASFRSTLDNAKYDPDDITASVVKNEKKGFSISDNFMWKPNHLWIDGININSGFSYDRQFSRKDKWANTSATAASNTSEEGIHEAYILPSQYTSISTVEGIPISTFVSLETTKVISNKANWVHSFVFGLSGRSSSNKGEGRKSGVAGLINFYTLDTGGETKLGYRDYDFNKTKTEIQISAYLEDRIYKKFEDHRILNVDLGIRYDNQSGYVSLQPRINSSLSLNKTFRIRGGLGMSSKAPSLNQVYTGDRYIDRLIGDGIYTYPGVYQKAWIQTIITSGDNLNLKPSKSYRTEAGIDINLPFASVNFTGYYNKLFDGFSYQKLPVYKVLPKPVVTVIGSEIPTYEINGTEKFYYFTNSIANSTTSEDTGAEAIINFKKIKALNLDVSMNASYVRSKDFSDVKQYITSTNLSSIERYGVFNPRPDIQDNMTMSFNFSYHIPSVGLLIGLRSEHVLYKNSNSLTNNYPIGYLDNELVYHEIPKQDQTDLQKYGHLIQTNKETDYKMQNMLHNFHLRVSKDFLNGFSVSLYATNFLNVKPYYYDEKNIKTLSDVANFSFGTRLNYEF